MHVFLNGNGLQVKTQYAGYVSKNEERSCQRSHVSPSDGPGASPAASQVLWMCQKQN